MELDINFSKNNFNAHYFIIDSKIFNNATNFKGNMFPLEKLISALIIISNDIKKNYVKIFSGNKEIWEKIIPIVLEKHKKIRNRNISINEDYYNSIILEKADSAFRQKKYKKVIKLLKPIKEILSKSYIAKYNFSKKKKRKFIVKILPKKHITACL